jgi:hypothetical protein
VRHTQQFQVWSSLAELPLGVEGQMGEPKKPATKAMRALLGELTEAIRARRLGRIAHAVAAATGNRIPETTTQEQLIGLLEIMLAGLEREIDHKDPQIRRRARALLEQWQRLVPYGNSGGAKNAD